MQFFVKKMQDKFNNQFNQKYENTSKKEGEVTIEGKKKSPKTKDNNVGDYVDFEEVDS